MAHRGNVNGFAHGNYQRNLRIAGSPFRYIVTEDGTSASEELSVRMPSAVCTTSPRSNAGQGEGRWIQCRLAGARQECPSDGWVFVPHTCAYRIFTPEQVLAATTIAKDQAPWIAVTGGSVMRGSFHAMLDYIGQGRRAAGSDCEVT